MYRTPSLKSRKNSIVELLSSPPLLYTDNKLDWSDLEAINLAELSRLVLIDTTYSLQQAFETLLSNDLTSLPVAVSPDTELTLTFDYSDLNIYLLLIMNKINLKDLVKEGSHGRKSLLGDKGKKSDIGDKLNENDGKEGETGSGGSGSLSRRGDDDSEENPTYGKSKSVSEDVTDDINTIQAYINKGKKGGEVPIDVILKLNHKNPFIKFNQYDTLGSIVEVLGNGVHRVAIVDDHTKIIGILSQRRLIKYFWENARRFDSLDLLFNSTLQELKIGSNTPITIYDDQPLIEALLKMYTEKITSLAVIDKSNTLIGNISIVDVKNVTSSKNSHLLYKTVLNFISYNLSQKGIEKGQDQFPIFHVNNSSSLGRVIAKLVATQSHRLWIVESRPTLSNQNTMSTSNSVNSISSSNSNTSNSNHNNSSAFSNPITSMNALSLNTGSTKPNTHSTSSSASDTPTTIETVLNASTEPFPHHQESAFSHASESSFPNQHQHFSPHTPSTPNNGFNSQNESNYGLPGKLIGVVTLTDILGLFAKTKGVETDPTAARNQRRRSSSSATRSSIDSAMSVGGGVSISGPTLQHTNSNVESQDIFRKSFTKDSGFK